MADKKAIELGKKLHRLIENEDFAPFLAELESRIEGERAALELSGSVINVPPHISANCAQRLHVLVSLRDWLDDEIERGGAERMKELNENKPAEAAS